MNARRLFTVPLSVAALLAAAPLNAHFVPLTPAELVDRSEQIVVATVAEQSSRWSGNTIYTDTVLQVEDQLRGDGPERLTISQPGGSIGDEAQGTCLSVPLEPGERYLLFLADPDRPMPIVGGQQGAVRDSSGFRGIVEEVRAYLNGESPDLRAIAAAAEEGLRSTHDRYRLSSTPAVPPIVFTPLPKDSPFSPHDQRQMAYWNAYHPDLFQVGPPTGLWEDGNGAFEIGFPDTIGGFGDWPAFAESAILWRTKDGHIVEADIAFNPAISWTLNEDEATRPQGPHSFREALLGHLGEAWGLGFSFLQPQDSVLALKAQESRLAYLFADDTAAVRAAFGGAPIRDGLITSYYGFTPTRPSVSAVRRGGSFKLMSPIKIENPGTEALVNPQVEVYLVPRRFSMEKAVSLRRVRIQGTIPSGAAQPVVIGQVTVPRTVQPGVYYLAFRLLAPGDKLPANDIAWSHYNATLTVKNR